MSEPYSAHDGECSRIIATDRVAVAASQRRQAARRRWRSHARALLVYSCFFACGRHRPCNGPERAQLGKTKEHTTSNYGGLVPCAWSHNGAAYPNSPPHPNTGSASQRVHEATSMVACVDTARVSTVRCLKSVSAARSRSSLRVQPAAAHICEQFCAVSQNAQSYLVRQSCNAPHRMECGPYTRPNTPSVETINVAPHPAVPKPVAISQVMSTLCKSSAFRSAALVVLIRALAVARCPKHQGCTSSVRVLQAPTGTRGYERARLRRLRIGLTAWAG